LIVIVEDQVRVQFNLKMTKTIIVTGASRGIGLAIVRSLLAQSSETRVIGIARSKDALSAIAKESNGRFEFVAGSITEEGTRRKAVDMAGDKLDGLVLNAG
jgi:NAD(P)-dependent dehydrogenase (short-subunit alcohol dehydrogenase family)